MLDSYDKNMIWYDSAEPNDDTQTKRIQELAQLLAEFVKIKFLNKSSA